MQQAVLVILRIMAGQASQSKSGRTALAAVIAAPVAVLLILLSLIGYILTAPFELMDSTLDAFRAAYSYLVGGNQSFGQDQGLTDQEIADMLPGTTGERQAVLAAALTLVDRVPYFWGGKSAAGWNDAWGTPAEVTSPGSSTTGTIRPYGLDCSGFVDWAFRTAGISSDLGGNAAYQATRTAGISMEQMVPGDLAFVVENGRVTHVGIFYGWTEDGTPRYIHSSASAGGVVLNGSVKYFSQNGLQGLA